MHHSKNIVEPLMLEGGGTNSSRKKLTIEERIEKSKAMTVVCCVTPNYGHMFPMSRIAIELQDRGHNVHIVTLKCAKAAGVPKIFEGTGVTVHMTESIGNLEYDEVITKGIISGKESLDNGKKISCFENWTLSW